MAARRGGGRAQRPGKTYRIGRRTPVPIRNDGLEAPTAGDTPLNDLVARDARPPDGRPLPLEDISTRTPTKFQTG